MFTQLSIKISYKILHEIRPTRSREERQPGGVRVGVGGGGEEGEGRGRGGGEGTACTVHIKKTSFLRLIHTCTCEHRHPQSYMYNVHVYAVYYTIHCIKKYTVQYTL